MNQRNNVEVEENEFKYNASVNLHLWLRLGMSDAADSMPHNVIFSILTSYRVIPAILLDIGR